MRKISKEYIDQREELQARFQLRAGELEEAVQAFNSLMETEWAKVETALNAYNEVVGDGNAWQEAVAAEIQEFIDDHSEKWQEGEKGQQYDAWRQEYEEELQAADLEKPDDLDLDLEDLAEVISYRNESIGGE